MLNFLTLILVLTIGIALSFSIIWRRLAPYWGDCLLKTAAHIKFPFSNNIQLDIQSPSTPKRVILRFSRSVGFYNGDIKLENGGATIYSQKLPILSEFRNKLLRFHNEDIPRQTDTIVILIRNFNEKYPLTLLLNLDHNIHDVELKTAFDINSEEKIEIMVRG